MSASCGVVFTAAPRAGTFLHMIVLEEIVHAYRSPWPGRPVARSLDGVSLHVSPGEVVGLVGVNGAGKTTLLRILLGYLRPDSGRVSLAGLSPRRYAEDHGIGYVPERVAIPPGWTVEGALRAYALMGDAGEDLDERVAGTVERLGLAGVRTSRVGRLSKGNLQRVAIAQALLCDRRLLVLDEPTDGLDPVWMAEFRTMLAEWRARGGDGVALVATHDLPLLERVADRVVMLHAGRLVADLRRGEGLEEGALEAVFLEHTHTAVKS